MALVNYEVTGPAEPFEPRAGLIAAAEERGTISGEQPLRGSNLSVTCVTSMGRRVDASGAWCAVRSDAHHSEPPTSTIASHLSTHKGARKMSLTLAAILAESALRYPDRDAVVIGPQRMHGRADRAKRQAERGERGGAQR